MFLSLIEAESAEKSRVGTSNSTILNTQIQHTCPLFSTKPCLDPLTATDWLEIWHRWKYPMTTKECQIVHCDNKLKSVKLYTVFVLYSPFCLQLFTARRVEICVDIFSVLCPGVCLFASLSVEGSQRGATFSYGLMTYDLAPVRLPPL